MKGNRPISEVEAQLRTMKAAPKMQIALEVVLPMIREHYEQLRSIALVTGLAEDERNADSWLTPVLLAEHALKGISPQLQLRRAAKSERVVQLPRRVL